MRLRHIEIFNAVYTTGSVSDAARAIHVTQPTVSKILKHAEQQLGYPLFRRVKGRLLPCPEAKILYQKTREIDTQMVSLQRLAKNLKDKQDGCVRVSSAAAIGVEFLPRALVEYRRSHRNIQFEIQTQHYANIFSELYEQQKDIGIVFNGDERPGIQLHPVCTGEFVCAYAGDEFPDLPDRIQLSDLAGKSLIGIDDSGPLATTIESLLFDEAIDIASNITAQTYFSARNLVALGAGISVMDQFSAGSHGYGDIKIKRFDPAITFTVNMAYLQNRTLPVEAIQFMDFFADWLCKEAAFPN